VGGLYREQGFEVVTKWLNSVFQPQVEAFYRDLRNDYLMLSGPKAVLLPRESTTSYPPSALSSCPAGERHRSLPPRAEEPQQETGWVGESRGDRLEAIDQSGGHRRRRRSSGRSGDSGKQGLVSPRRHSKVIPRHPLTTRFRFSPCADGTSRSLHRRTGSDRSETSRKRTRR